MFSKLDMNLLTDLWHASLRAHSSWEFLPKYADFSILWLVLADMWELLQNIPTNIMDYFKPLP